MEPGRKLDALIAEKIFNEPVGWKRFSGTSYFGVPMHLDWFSEGPNWSATKFPNIGEDFNTFPDKIRSDGVIYKSSVPEDCQSFGWLRSGYRVLNYSTDIAASQAVVEKLKELGFMVDIYKSNYCRIFIEKLKKKNYYVVSVVRATESTTPHSICLAALKAVGVEI